MLHALVIVIINIITENKHSLNQLFASKSPPIHPSHVISHSYFYFC